MARLTLARKIRRHHANHLEERGGLRRQPVRSASSLSISGKSVSISGGSPAVVGRVLETLDSRASISQLVGPRLLQQRVTHLHAMPPRIIRNSDRPRASDRTMITTRTSISLAKSLRLDWNCRRGQRTMGRTNRSEQNPERFRGTHIYSGLEIKTSHPSSGRGRSSFLTSLFIELIETAQATPAGIVSEVAIFQQKLDSVASNGFVIFASVDVPVRCAQAKAEHRIERIVLLPRKRTIRGWRLGQSLARCIISPLLRLSSVFTFQLVKLIR